MRLQSLELESSAMGNWLLCRLDLVDANSNDWFPAITGDVGYNCVDNSDLSVGRFAWVILEMQWSVILEMLWFCAAALLLQVEAKSKVEREHLRTLTSAYQRENSSRIPF